MQHPDLYGKKDSNHNLRNSQIYEETEFVHTSSSSSSDDSD